MTWCVKRLLFLRCKGLTQTPEAWFRIAPSRPNHIHSVDSAVSFCRQLALLTTVPPSSGLGGLSSSSSATNVLHPTSVPRRFISHDHVSDNLSESQSASKKAVNDVTKGEDKDVEGVSHIQYQTDLRLSEDSFPERSVGRTLESQSHLQLLTPDSPPGSRLLRVAVIGRPNCGKSTLTNALLGWRVSSVSGKVHTTRKNTLAVYTQDEVQIVFLDTPGILQLGSRKKHRLEKSMEIDPIHSLASADLVAAMVDVSIPQATRELDIRLMELLYLYRHIPSVLILNKVDLVKKRDGLLQTVRILWDRERLKLKAQTTSQKSRKQRLFEAADRKMSVKDDQVENVEPIEVPHKFSVSEDSIPQWPLTRDEFQSAARGARRALEGHQGWPLFQEVFKVSATQGDGLAQLKSYLLDQARPSPWAYHSSLVTDQDTQEVVLMCVREKLLDNLHNEVPYQLGLDLVILEVDPEDDLLNVVINVLCWSDRQLTIFLGRDGEMIRAVSSQAKQAMMDTFRCDVRLKLVAINKSVKGKRR